MLCIMDILIHVTSFFREPETFQILASQIIPKLIEGKTEREPLRVWVPGCSTGEEAYSIAIVLVEYLGDQLGKVPLQIFATDLSDPSIEHARAGVYSGATLAEVGPERLGRFFTKIQRELPGDSGHPRHVHVRASGPDPGPAFFPHRPDQLPQCSDLS